MSAPISPVQTLKEAGNTAFKQQDYWQAVDCYSQAIVPCTQALDPNVSELYSNRARCYKLLNKLADVKDI